MRSGMTCADAQSQWCADPGMSCCCLLQVKLPFSIHAAKADATIHSDGDRLQVRLPFRSYTDILADEKGGLNEIAAC
jgi:hypothetical protein